MTTVTRDEICQRDGWRCVRCALFVLGAIWSVQHLQRGQGHYEGAAGKILLCGTGTTGCHGWVTAHFLAARDEGGWAVSRYWRTQEQFEAHQVRYAIGPNGYPAWCLLRDDLTITEVRAA